jgi:hypothetical protein
MKTSLTKSLGLEEINWKDIFTKGINGKLKEWVLARLDVKRA